MKITYLGLIKNQFKYNVELNGHNFDFTTGIGWIAWGNKNPDPTQYKPMTQDEIAEVVKAQSKNSWIPRATGAHCYRREPKKEDVLECLKDDVDAGSLSFDEFCDNFGYSSDSINALEVYRRCMETAKKLRNFDWPKYDSEETA